MTTRKFYKTVLTYTVLSEKPIPDNLEMKDIMFECTDGFYSGATTGQKETVLNGKQAAKALEEQGSDPDFFQLDEKGNDAATDY